MLWQIALVEHPLKTDNGLTKFHSASSNIALISTDTMNPESSVRHTNIDSKSRGINKSVKNSVDFDESQTPAPMLSKFDRQHSSNLVTDKKDFLLPNINKSPLIVSTNKQRRNSESNLYKSRSKVGTSLRKSSDNVAFIPEIDRTSILNSTRKPALPIFKMKSTSNIRSSSPQHQ